MAAKLTANSILHKPTCPKSRPQPSQEEAKAEPTACDCHLQNDSEEAVLEAVPETTADAKSLSQEISKVISAARRCEKFNSKNQLSVYRLVAALVQAFKRRSQEDLDEDVFRELAEWQELFVNKISKNKQCVICNSASVEALKQRTAPVMEAQENLGEKAVLALRRSSSALSDVASNKNPKLFVREHAVSLVNSVFESHSPTSSGYSRDNEIHLMQRLFRNIGKF